MKLFLLVTIGLSGLSITPAIAQDIEITDTEFVALALPEQKALIELAKLAADRTANKDVKKLAQKIQKDQEKALDELTALAAKKDITVASNPKPEQRAIIERLNAMTGAAFDRAFVDELAKQLALLSDQVGHEAGLGKDDDLRSWAGKYTLVVEEEVGLTSAVSSQLKDATHSCDRGLDQRLQAAD
jgi:putative membrane protein